MMAPPFPSRRRLGPAKNPALVDGNGPVTLLRRHVEDGNGRIADPGIVEHDVQTSALHALIIGGGRMDVKRTAPLFPPFRMPSAPPRGQYPPPP
jgi:hypothetical protein